MPAVSAEDADPDEFGLVALLALAGGGIIGSGWLLGGYSAAFIAGSWAWLSWLLGGVLMFVVALVMVELGRNAPENGGLVSWPARSSGPLVAVVVAAALWIFYALNPASEAAAVVQAFRFRALYRFDPVHPGPTGWGIVLSAVIMVPIVASNLLAFRLIQRGTVGLTAFKVFVPVAVLVLLFLSGFDRHAIAGHPVAQGDGSVRAVISAITGGGVVYAYIGFQGPLDFAGQVRNTQVRRFGIRLNEGVRLRIAVLGTVLGSIVLYTLLQVVYLGHTGWTPGDPDSPYTKFAAGIAVTGTMFVVLLRIDAAVSPVGSGVVFVLLLAREVESLSQIRLTDSRLATPRRLWSGGPERTLAILGVNLVVGWIGLILLGGNWGTMASASSVLVLLVYSMAAVSLMAFRSHYAGKRVDRFRLRRSWWVPAWFGFVGVCEVLYWAEWPVLWRGMALMAAGVLLLLLLPVISHRIERFRLYDAENLMTRHSDRNRFDLYGAVVFAVHLGALLTLTALGMPGGHQRAVLHEPVGSLLVALLGTATLILLHRCSTGCMRERPPVLREPGR